MSHFRIALAFAVMTIFAAGDASAIGFCQLPNGQMGLQCIVPSSGQIYGCVTDLKECGALLHVPVYSVGLSGATLAIDEAGLKALEASEQEFAVRDGASRGKAQGGKSLTADYTAENGLRVKVRGWDPTVKQNVAAQKLSQPVEGYQLYIALPGYRVTVDDDGTLEFAITDQGVKRARALGVEITIETGGKKGFDAGSKDSGYRFQQNQTDLEFVHIRR